MSLAIQESAFRQKVQRALEQVKRVLETNKHPVYASEAAHKYADKYMLAEFLTNTALASHLTCLSHFGVSPDQLETMMEWAKTRSVSLRFCATEKCSFVKKVTRDEESARRHVTESTLFGKTTSKVVTTITEYVWRFEYSYEVLTYRGTGESDGERLQFRARSCSHEMITSTDKNPRKENVVRPNLDVNITWLLCALQSPSAGVVVPNFSIDRAPDTCRTPSNNENVSSAMACFSALSSWTESVHAYFTSEIYPLLKGSALDLSAINCDGVFVPVLPLFNEVDELKSTVCSELTSGEGEAEGSSAVVPASSTLTGSNNVLFGTADINSFLVEEQRSFGEKFSSMDAVFSSPYVLVSSVEARYLVTLLHMREVTQFYHSGIHTIEEMLRNQLVAAIGKVVSPSDFSNYMRFHNYKVFGEAYRPKPFCYAVRRSTIHSPEGVLSIEEDLCDGSMADPIYTICNGPSDGSEHPMRFTLNAATSVTFRGDRYVHGWLSQKFAYNQYDSNESKLVLKAMSRQFSSYVVLVGRISSADTFDPKFGMIVQNKDELSIPLDLERIPSAKEFKDAIDSLSPEQQAFAKAFRSMQLESTLFGVCVVQIKPQLEKLLRLTPDSLTKEIQLTQDLMELFITYQLPSDLLAFAGDDDAPSADRIAAVKGYVSAMHDMIKGAKARELESKKEADLYRSNLAAPGPFGSYVRGGGATYGPPQGPPDGATFGPPQCPPDGATFSFGGAPSNALSFSAGDNFRGGGATFGAPPCPPPCPAPMGGASMKNSMPTQINRRLSRFGDVPAPMMMSQQQSQQAEIHTTGVQQDTTPHSLRTHRFSEADVDSDCTKIPAMLEKQFELLDKDGAVRPTIINPGSTWTKRAQAALLADPTSSTLGVDEQKSEKSRAFDLLDALSRSGGLSVDHASLHVVVAATHCFDLSLMDTIVKNNVNPIEKVERSTMIMASTIHGQSVEELVQSEHQGRLLDISLDVDL